MSRGHTQHLQDRELRSYVTGTPEPAEIEDVERHVRSCPECRRRLEGMARSLVHDNRAELRFQTSGSGILRSFAPLLPERWEVEVVDVSKNGIGLLAPVRLSPGVVVQLLFGKRVALGEVRYSEQVGEEEFRIGIRLHDVKP